jgi:hypothetical protein
MKIFLTAYVVVFTGAMAFLNFAEEKNSQILSLEIENIYLHSLLYLKEQKIEELETEAKKIRPLLKAIAFQESRLNPNVKDGRNNDIGMYQITPIAVKEYNIQYNDSLKHEDMRCVELAEKVTKGLLVVGVRNYMRENNKFPTISDIGRMHNGGIYRGWKKEVTENYGSTIEKNWEKFVFQEINS